MFSSLLHACFGAPRYLGPESDHFDGRRFRNLDPESPRSFAHLMQWQLTRDARPWPEQAAIPPVDPPPQRVSEGYRVTYVNHATVLIQLPGINILTDPVWSETIGPMEGVGSRRHKLPGVALSDLPPIDVVVVSHNHYDHFDAPTLARLHERDAPRFIAGLGSAALFAHYGIPDAVELDWWERVEVGPAQITFTPAQHWSRRGLTDHNVNLWGSFFIRVGEQSVYFAGDTGAGSHFARVRARLGEPDLALLPIGAYSPRWFMHPHHIDPEGAVRAHQQLGARKSLAIHWGSFRLSDEGMDDPPRELSEALHRLGVDPERFVAIDNGEHISDDGLPESQR